MSFKLNKYTYKRIMRDITLVCLADGLVGLSYGAVSTTSGFELWVPILLSIFVLAGASEFLFVGIISSGGSVLSAVLAGLLVNLRHLAFGLSVKEFLGKGPSTLLGCHVMNDESVAFAISQQSFEEKKLAYWTCGLGILLIWPMSVWAGATIGSFVENTSVLGLDAMFPAIIFALVLPGYKSKKKVIPPITGAFVAVASVPFLPIGLPHLLSIGFVLFMRKYS